MTIILVLLQGCDSRETSWNMHYDLFKTFVSSVIDGDTIIVFKYGKWIKIPSNEKRPLAKQEIPVGRMKGKQIIRRIFLSDNNSARGEEICDGMLRSWKMLTIRLANIDSPELNQPFGTQAKAYTESQVLNKYIKIQIIGTDNYNRNLAFISGFEYSESEPTVGDYTYHYGDLLYIDDDMDLNITLVGFGYAWYYNNNSGNKKYINAQHFAQAKKHGLWQNENPIPPWEWRKNH